MATGSTQSGRTGPDERVRLLAERAGAHAQRGELASARELYAQVLVLDPAHSEAISFIAIAALQAGEIRRSIELLRQGVAANPDDAVLHKNLGLACRAGGEPQ